MLCLVLSCVLSLVFAGCGGDSEAPSVSPSGGAPASSGQTQQIAMPQSGTSDVKENDVAKIDTSNADQGYAMVSCHTGENKKLKVQIKHGDTLYNYDLSDDGQEATFPFSCGNGTYAITVYQNLTGNKYAPLLSSSVDVQLESEFAPYLLPNQFVDYTPESKAVAKGFALTENAQSDLERVQEIFTYIITHVKYDNDKADAVQQGALTGYLPDVDDTLATNKGICFDYAALLATMLRSHNIPAKLVTGYAQPLGVYHAWNMIYITDVGWVSTYIYFDGTNWQLADPTFAASGSTDGVSYQPVYEY